MAIRCWRFIKLARPWLKIHSCAKRPKGIHFLAQQHLRFCLPAPAVKTLLLLRHLKNGGPGRAAGAALEICGPCGSWEWSRWKTESLLEVTDSRWPVCFCFIFQGLLQRQMVDAERRVENLKARHSPPHLTRRQKLPRWLQLWQRSQQDGVDFFQVQFYTNKLLA